MAKVKPDPILVQDQLQALQTLKLSLGVEAMLAFLFWILVKKPKATDTDPGVLMPFRLNRIQQNLEHDLGRNNLFVKGRQIGSTTYFMLRRLFFEAILNPGTGCLLIAQNNEYAEKIFRMAKRAYRWIGAVDPYHQMDNTLSTSLKQNVLHVAVSNRRELIFDQLESGLMIASAEVEEAGQSITLVHVLADEYSRWPRNPEATLSNVRGAIVPGGTLDIACTANGAQGSFFEMVNRAMSNLDISEARLHYYSWYWTDDYELALSEKEKDKLQAELTEEELLLIAKMHKELDDVAYVSKVA